MKTLKNKLSTILLTAIWWTLGTIALHTTLHAQAGSLPNGARTNLDIMALNTSNQKLEKFSGKDWPASVPGYNIVRTFTNGAGQKFLFLLNGNHGSATVFQLQLDGSLGNSVWAIETAPVFRCTGADIIRSSEVNKLITQDSFTGRIRTFAFNEDGSINLLSKTTKTLPEMKDKNLFQVYYHYFYGWELIGIDTWTGDAVGYWLDLQKVAEKKWTRGWTSIDHLYTGGVTYRLLYKAAGDPYKQPNESGDEAGRFTIETVAQNGVDGQFIQNITKGLEFTSARFVQLPLTANNNSRYGILFYRRTTGDYELYEFNPQSGLGNLVGSGKLSDGDTTPPYIDVAPYSAAGKLCFAFVNADNVKPVSYAQAEKMAQIIHQGLSNQVVGYQFMLAQSGRVMFRRGGGQAKLDLNAANNIAMTTNTQLNIGSVSKMLTALTLMKLAEQGWVDLSKPIANYLPAGQAGPNSWAKKTPVLNLLAHTTGMSKDNKTCAVDAATLKVDCQQFFNDPPKLACGMDGLNQYNCAREYNNENFIAARKVIEYITSAHTSIDITKLTHDLWAKSIDLEQMSCQIPQGAYYYRACNGEPDCITVGNQSWHRELATEPQNNWSAYCSSGGWEGSARELIAFLGAIRYGNIIQNQTLADLLLSTNLKDYQGSATAYSWDWTAAANGETTGSKGGLAVFDQGGQSKTYFNRMPDSLDAVLMTNTKPLYSFGPVLTAGYTYGIQGQDTLLENGRYPFDPSVANIDGVAINTTKPALAGASEHVAVARANDGSLQLKALRASRELTGDLDLVAQSSTSSQTANASPELAITDGPAFATVSLGGFASQLTLLTWQFDGTTLTKHKTALGALGTEVAATKVASTNGSFRIVTATRNLNGKLQLDVWDAYNSPTPQLSSIKLVDTFIDEAATNIEIKNLSLDTPWGQPAQFVTAIRQATGALAVTTWNVAANGKLQRQSSTNLGAGLLVDSGAPGSSPIALDTIGDGTSQFFNGSGFMTTSINKDHILDVVTWHVDGAGEISKVDRKATGGTVLTQSLSATISAVTLTDSDAKKLKLIKWAVDGAGIITRTWSIAPNSPLLTRTASTGNRLLAGQMDAGGWLTVFNWKILE